MVTADTLYIFMFTSEILKVVSQLEFLKIYKNNIIIDRICKGLVKR